MNQIHKTQIHSYNKESSFEPVHDKTYKMACAPSKDSDQPGYPDWMDA